METATGLPFPEMDATSLPKYRRQETVVALRGSTSS
jgi:hypothetical protein